MPAARLRFTLLFSSLATALGCNSEDAPVVCTSDADCPTGSCDQGECIDVDDAAGDDSDDDAPSQGGAGSGSDTDDDRDGNGPEPGQGPAGGGAAGTDAEPGSGGASEVAGSASEPGTGGTSSGGKDGTDGGASGGVTSEGGASDGGSAGAPEGGAAVAGAPGGGAGGAGQGGGSAGGSAGAASGGAGGATPVPACGGDTVVEGCVSLCEAACALDDALCGEPCSILECAENELFVTTCVSECEGDVAACGLEAACMDAEGQTCESYGPMFCAPDTPCNPVDSTGGAVAKFCNNVTTGDGGSVELNLDVGGVQLVAPSGECAPLSGPCTSVPGGEAIPYRLSRTTGEVFFQGVMTLEPGTEQLILADVDAEGVYLQQVDFAELSEQVPEITSCEAFTFDLLFPD